MHRVTFVTLQNRFNHNELSARTELSLGGKCDVARGKASRSLRGRNSRENAGTISLRWCSSTCRGQRLSGTAGWNCAAHGETSWPTS